MSEKKFTVRYATQGGSQVKAEADAIATRIKQTFYGVTLAQKSAADSASVFEQALREEERAFDELRASVDPAYAATRRYEAAVDAATRAVKQGAATQEQANLVIQQARSRLDTFGGAIGAGGRGMKAYQGQIQNAAFQLGDFAVQVGAGTAASTALAMQLPQLLGGFGVLGAVIGAGVAIGVPLLTAYFRDNEASAASLEDQIDALSDAIGRYEQARDAATSSDLFQSYGQQTDQARAFLQVQKDIANVQAQQALSTARSGALSAFGDFGGMSSAGFLQQVDALAQLQAEFDRLSAAQSLALQNGGFLADGTIADMVALQAQIANVRSEMENLGRARSAIDDIAAQFGATRDQAVDLVAAILRVNEAEGPAAAAAAAQELAAQLGIATDNFRDSTDEARTLGQQLLDVVLQGMQFSALDLASPIAAAASTAAVLAQNMNISLAAASALMSMGGGPSPVIFDPRDPNYDPVAAEMARLAENPNRVSPFDASRLPQPVSTGGGGGGGGSSSDPAAGGKSPWFTPEQEQQIIDAAKTITDAQEAVNASIDKGTDAVANFLFALGDGADAAKKALADLLMQMAQVELKAGLTSLAGSNNWLGTMFAALGTAITGTPAAVPVGANATGTDYWQGGPTWVGERGPEIVNLPRGSSVMNANKSAKTANGGIEIVVRSELGTIVEIVRNTAGALITQAAPGIVRQSVVATGNVMTKTKKFGNR
jgi:hypothetical protein